MHQSTTFPQSRNTHCSYTTAHISFYRKSCILAHIERDMAKLFFYGA